MIDFNLKCIVQGERFSPRIAAEIAKVKFDKAIEPGEVVDRGKYRGRPSPRGWASLSSSEPSIGSFLKKMERVVPILRASGADRISLHLCVEYRQQCNWELTTTEIGLLAGIGLPLLVSCYPADEGDGAAREKGSNQNGAKLGKSGLTL
jgi:hypothetical protein